MATGAEEKPRATVKRSRQALEEKENEGQEVKAGQEGEDMAEVVAIGVSCENLGGEREGGRCMSAVEDGREGRGGGRREGAVIGERPSKRKRGGESRTRRATRGASAGVIFCQGRRRPYFFRMLVFNEVVTSF